MTVVSQVLDRNAIKHIIYCAVLFSIAYFIYENSLEGSFVWDDRAAIVKNPDVIGSSTIETLLNNDFWGQNMQLIDSHKSYRPVTVLTFRHNYASHGMSAYHFHYTNVMIYGVVCVLMYLSSLLWLSTAGAAICALLFTLHPVHVEGVASVVGRADSLCAMFYLFAMLSYTLSIRIPRLGKYLYVVSILSALLSSLSKELGVTVFGIFVVIEVLETLRNRIPSITVLPTVSSTATAPVAPPTPTRVNRPGTVSTPLSELKPRFTFEGIPSANKTPVKKVATPAPASAVKQVTIVDSKAPRGETHDQSVLSGLKIIFNSLYRTFHPSSESLRRIVILLLVLAWFMWIRIKLNGPHQLYQWTVLENHITLLPTQWERVLSYAQMHFWYVFKLMYPRYLCFDYGYACIPTITTLYDLRNLLPLSVYSGLLYLVSKSIRRLRVNIILAVALFLLPLFPALNIVFPIGALVAERLMFVPSIGYCMLVGEMLSVDCLEWWIGLSESWLDFLWHTVYSMLSQMLQDALVQVGLTRSPAKNTVSPMKKKLLKMALVTTTDEVEGSAAASVMPAAAEERGSTSSSSGSKRFPSLGVNSVFLVLLPLLWSYRGRVISRNLDWRDEMSIYSSALQVCPLSLKALSNYGVLRMNTVGNIKHQEFNETQVMSMQSSLQSSLTAVELQPGQVQPLVNAALAYQKLGDYANSLHVFQRAAVSDPTNGRVCGYLGSLYQEWAVATVDPRQSQILNELAIIELYNAVGYGFDAPSMLHRLGSLYLSMNYFEQGIFYLQGALDKSFHLKELRKGSNLPMEDDIVLHFTYNQLAMAQWRNGEYALSEKSFLEGLKHDPNSMPLLINLGSLYNERGETDKARVMLTRSIEASGKAVSPALLNNLGLLELETQNFVRALELFEQALRIIQTNQAELASLESTDGLDVTEIIKNNVMRARAGIRY